MLCVNKVPNFETIEAFQICLTIGLLINVSSIDVHCLTKIHFLVSCSSQMRPDLAKFCRFWQNFQNLLQTFEGLFIVWQNFDPTFLQNIHVNGQILKNTLSIWSHCSSHVWRMSGPGGCQVASVCEFYFDDTTSNPVDLESFSQPSSPTPTTKELHGFSLKMKRTKNNNKPSQCDRIARSFAQYLAIYYNQN